MIEAVLRPGDCLYLPRGFLHAAQALGGISTHLTIGVHVWTRYAVAERLAQQAIRTLAGDADIRATLNLGVEFTGGALEDDIAAVKRALVTAIEQADPAVLTAGLRAAARGASRAAPIGPLAQFRSAAALDGGSTVAVRGHLAATVERKRDGTALLRSRADELRLDAGEVSAVETLLLRGSTSAAELGVELSRRLVLAGVAIVAEAPGSLDSPRE